MRWKRQRSKLTPWSAEGEVAVGRKVKAGAATMFGGGRPQAVGTYNQVYQTSGSALVAMSFEVTTSACSSV
eukprot:2643481-Pyramimonas_sp.AAC.1